METIKGCPKSQSTISTQYSGGWFGSLRIVIFYLFDGRYMNVLPVLYGDGGGNEFSHMCVCGCPENKVPFICFVVGT